jgi:hypothetical protein
MDKRCQQKGRFLLTPQEIADLKNSEEFKDASRTALAIHRAGSGSVLDG